MHRPGVRTNMQPESIFLSRPRTDRIRFSALQSLRGLAALIVILRHVLACYPLPWHMASVIIFFLFNSPAAVTLFFTLSGFVLVHAMENRGFAFATCAAFWTQRIFRILPALIVITGLSFLYTRLPFSARPLSMNDPFMDGLLPHDIPITPINLVKCMLSLSGALVPQNWTVLVELIVGVLFPFLWLSTKYGARYFLPVALLSLIMAFCAPAGGKGLPFIYGFSFVAGAAAYRFWQNTDIELTGAGILLSVVGLSLPTTLLTEPETLGAVFNAPYLTVPESMFAALLIFGLAHDDTPIARAFSSRFLLWLGDISFSLYLIHFLIIALVGRLLTPVMPSLPVVGREAAVLAATLLIALPSSHILYEYVEKPFNRVGRGLAAAWNAPRR